MARPCRVRRAAWTRSEAAQRGPGGHGEDLATRVETARQAARVGRRLGAERVILQELPRRLVQRRGRAAVAAAVDAVDREASVLEHVVVEAFAGLAEVHNYVVAG